MCRASVATMCTKRPYPVVTRLPRAAGHGAIESDGVTIFIASSVGTETVDCWSGEAGSPEMLMLCAVMTASQVASRSRALSGPTSVMDTGTCGVGVSHLGWERRAGAGRVREGSLCAGGVRYAGKPSGSWMPHGGLWESIRRGRDRPPPCVRRVVHLSECLACPPHR
jgi:hypothetical protein